jgi:phage host-nuclease inhibitor protein Gam
MYLRNQLCGGEKNTLPDSGQIVTSNFIRNTVNFRKVGGLLDIRKVYMVLDSVLPRIWHFSFS